MPACQSQRGGGTSRPPKQEGKGREGTKQRPPNTQGHPGPLGVPKMPDTVARGSWERKLEMKQNRKLKTKHMEKNSCETTLVKGVYTC